MLKKSKTKLACVSLALNFIVPQNISAFWSYHELDEMETLAEDFSSESDDDFKNDLINVMIKPEYNFSFRTYSLALLLKKYKNFGEFANFFESTVVKKYNERRNQAPLIIKSGEEVIKDSEELLSTVLSGVYRETFSYLLYESLKKDDFFENKSLISEKIWNKWIEYLSTKTFVSDFNNPEESFREITDYFRFYTMKSIREILLKIKNNTLNTGKKQDFLKSAEENFNKIGLSLFKTENNTKVLDFDVIREIDKKIFEYQKVCLEHPEYGKMLKTILKSDIENSENINTRRTKPRVVAQKQKSQSKSKKEPKTKKKHSQKIACVRKKNANVTDETYDIQKEDCSGKIITHKWKWEALPNVPDGFVSDADDTYMDCLTGAFVSGLYGKSSSVNCFMDSWTDLSNTSLKDIHTNVPQNIEDLESQCQSVENQTKQVQSQLIQGPVKYNRTKINDNGSSLITVLMSTLTKNEKTPRPLENIFYYDDKFWFLLIDTNKPTQAIVPSVLNSTLANKLYDYITRQKIPVIIEICGSDDQKQNYYRYGVITDIEVDYTNVRSAGIQIRNVKFWDPLDRQKCTWKLETLKEYCHNFWALTN